MVWSVGCTLLWLALYRERRMEQSRGPCIWGGARFEPWAAGLELCVECRPPTQLTMRQRAWGGFKQYPAQRRIGRERMLHSTVSLCRKQVR